MFSFKLLVFAYKARYSLIVFIVLFIYVLMKKKVFIRKIISIRKKLEKSTKTISGKNNRTISLSASEVILISYTDTPWYFFLTLRRSGSCGKDQS